MPYFLDSNVIIGYIFHTADHWGRAAVWAFEDPEPNHSGFAVQRECFGLCDTDSGKVRTVRKDVVRALRHVIYELKRGRTLDGIIGVRMTVSARYLPMSGQLLQTIHVERPMRSC